MSCDAIVTITAVAQVSASALAACASEVLGEEGSSVTVGTETWTDATIGSETWTNNTIGTDTWLRSG